MLKLSGSARLCFEVSPVFRTRMTHAPLPPASSSSPLAVAFWVRVITGMTLDDGDVVRALGVKEWKECRELLKNFDPGKKLESVDL
jgi:hypothetical protein